MPKRKSKPRTKQTALKSKGSGRKVLQATKYQTGKSSVPHDRRRKAMQPGKRRSARGNVYFETRKNRSDLKGKRI